VGRLQQSEVDQFYSDCADDLFCFGVAGGNTSATFWDFSAEYAACSDVSTGCRPMRDIYPSGTAMVTQLWESSGVPAFTVVPSDVENETNSFSLLAGGSAGLNEPMWAPNPNDAVLTDVDPFPADHRCVSPHEGQMCHLAGDYYHDPHASPKDLSGSICSAWSDNSCCSVEMAVQTIQTDHYETYGPEFSHQKCGAVSDACTKWFLLEGCLYECDVNAGRYRHHVGAAGCDGGGNTWQISGMPLKVRANYL
jgi:hypothetical protein